MKILLINDETEKETEAQVYSLLEMIRVPVEPLVLSSSAEEDINKFAAFFSPFDADADEEQMPTHVLILSTLSGRWFDFLAGFSCGTRIPIVVYCKDAVDCIPGDFALYFSFFDNADSLSKFFKTENEVFKKQQAARHIVKAKHNLLHMGIPISSDSLAQCVHEGRLREVSFFLAAGFSPDTRNKAGVPLLNIAARTGNREMLRFLILTGAEMDIQAEDRGSSPLIDGVIGKFNELAADLVKAGANLNIQSKDGQTALVVAVGAGNEKMVEVLLKAGANPDIADHMGFSARKYAALFHKSSITFLFETFASAQKD